MNLRNYSPFSAIAFRHYRKDGVLMAVVVVRGTFHLYENMPLIRAEQQDPIQLKDEYVGDPQTSELLRVSDLVPFKPATDITLRACAFTPAGDRAASWLCGLRAGELSKVARVHGPRVWHPHWDEKEVGIINPRIERNFKEWKISQSEPVRGVALSWHSAFGGMKPAAQEGEEPVICDTNPLGLGWFDSDAGSRDSDIAAPLIEDMDRPITKAGQRYEPCGFGPVPPVWNQRLQYAGTYDDAWLENRHPFPPEDFDYRFYQCAPPGLIYDGYLAEGAELELACVHPNLRNIHCRLPAPQLNALTRYMNGQMWHHELYLDGLHIDMMSKPAIAHLTWRGWFQADNIRVIDLDAENRFQIEQEALQVKHSGLTPVDGFAP